MSKKAILTIDDIAPDREVVTVFGKDYELLDYEDMGLIRYSKFLKKYSAVGGIASKAAELSDEAAELSDEEFEKLDNELTEMTETVLMGIPHEIAAKIPIEKKQKVLAVFFTVATNVLMGKTEQIKAKMPNEEKPIGEN